MFAGLLLTKVVNVPHIKQYIHEICSIIHYHDLDFSHYYVVSNTEVELLGDGGLQLVELNPPDPWLADPREPLVLKDGEVKVCAFCYSHIILTP